MSESRGFWKSVAQRLRKRPAAVAGASVILLFILLAWLAPVLANNAPLTVVFQGERHFTAFRQLFPFNHLLKPDAVALRLDENPDWLLEQRELPDPALSGLWLPPIPYSPLQTRLDDVGAAPSRATRHFCGCDDKGRDVLARLLHGARNSLLVGFVAVGIAAVVGILLGALAGFFGGWLDTFVISRAIEVLMCFPTFFLILTVVAVMDPKYLSIWSIMLVIGLTTWTGIARFTRGEFLRLKSREFVLAAKALGAGRRRLIFRHILPSALTPVLVSVSFGIAGAILSEAGLSFLGVGVQPPDPSWGNVLSGVQTAWDQWWLGVFPGAAIFLSVLSYNLLGEGLRDALDPRDAT